MLTIFYLIMVVLFLTLLVGVIISIKKKTKYRKLLIALLIVITLIGVGGITYIKVQEYEEKAFKERHKNDAVEREKEVTKMNEVINLLNDIIYSFKDPQSVSIMEGAKRNGTWLLRIRATNSFGGYVNEIFIVYNGKLETQDTINSKDENFINSLNDYYNENGNDEILTEENIAEINRAFKEYFE